MPTFPLHCPSSGAMRSTSILHSLSWDSDGESVASIFSYSRQPPSVKMVRAILVASCPQHPLGRKWSQTQEGRMPPHLPSSGSIPPRETTPATCSQAVAQHPTSQWGAAPVALPPGSLALEKSITGFTVAWLWLILSASLPLHSG